MNVLIIGSGIIGTAVAYELARSGIQCTVVDKSDPGSEATTAAGGILGTQVEANGPDALFELMVSSRALYPSWVRRIENESKIKADYRECGLVQLAYSPEELGQLEQRLGWQRAAKQRVRRLDAQTLADKEPCLAGRPLGALLFDDDHVVDNRRLFNGLLRATKAAGARFRTARVKALDEAGGRVIGATTELGEVLRADVTIVCAGAWSSTIAGSGLPPSSIVPIRGQMLQVRLPSSPTKRILKHGIHYIVPRRDGRMVVGTTAEAVGYEKAVTPAGLTDILEGGKRLMPALADGQVTSSWAGLRPSTVDGLPFMGAADRAGLVYATGHFRNGILLAPITAQLVGQLVRGETPSHDLTPFRATRVKS